MKYISNSSDKFTHFPSKWFYANFVLISFNLAFLFNQSFIPSAQALQMTNSSFTINTSVSNSAQLSTKHNIASKKRLFTQQSIITDGFPTTPQNQYFLATILGTRIDFGSLSSGSPVARANQLSVSNGSSYGYTTLTEENHPLLSSQGQNFIPNTTCDNGQCTSNESDTWSNVLTYGFGYRCDDVVGSSCISAFNTSSNFKTFPGIPNYSLISSSLDELQNHLIQITYKVNISPNQQTGLYSNNILLVTLPKY